MALRGGRAVRLINSRRPRLCVKCGLITGVPWQYRDGVLFRVYRRNLCRPADSGGSPVNDVPNASLESDRHAERALGRRSSC